MELKISLEFGVLILLLIILLCILLVKENRTRKKVQTEQKWVQKSPVMMFVWKAEADWKIRHATSNVLSLGYMASQFTNQHYSFLLDLIYPRDLDRIVQEISRYSELGTPFFEQSYRMICADGKVKDVHTYNIAIRNRKQLTSHYRTYVMDVTGQKKLERHVINQEKKRIISQMSAGFSHELGNPLTTIKGLIQLLEREATNQDKKTFALILEEVNQLQHVLDRFEGMSGSQEYIFERKDITRILNQSLQMVGELSNQHAIDLELEIEENIPLIECDETQLVQAFAHLLENAIEAMPDGGRICVKLKRMRSQGVVVQLTDEGHGITEDRLQTLGDPIYLLEEKGIGMGLMITYNIIEGHQGSIRIHSQPNQGTTVHVFLPSRIDIKDDL